MSLADWLALHELVNVSQMNSKDEISGVKETEAVILTCNDSNVLS